MVRNGKGITKDHYCWDAHWPSGLGKTLIKMEK